MKNKSQNNNKPIMMISWDKKDTTKLSMIYNLLEKRKVLLQYDKQQDRLILRINF